MRGTRHRNAPKGQPCNSPGQRPISIYLRNFGRSAQSLKLPKSLGASLGKALAQLIPMLLEVAKSQGHRQLYNQRVARFFEKVPLALVLKVGNPMGKKSEPHIANVR